MAAGPLLVGGMSAPAIASDPPPPAEEQFQDEFGANDRTALRRIRRDPSRPDSGPCDNPGTVMGRGNTNCTA